MIGGKSFLARFFMLAVFFPWVSFRLNSMDTQAWAFILSIFFILSCIRYKVNKYAFLIFLLPFFCLFLLLFLDLNKHVLLALRGLAAYIFFTFVFFSSFLYVKIYGFPVRLLFFSNYTYVFFGVLQALFGNVAVIFFSAIRTTESRGVTSLAVEPTNFGIVLLFFSWYLLIFNGYRLTTHSKILLAINVFSIFFIAQSTMAACFVLLAAILMFIYRVRVVYIFIFFAIFYLLSIVLMEFFSDARIFRLAIALYRIGWIDLVFTDASVNYRVAGLIFPYLGVLSNDLLPGGFASFSFMASELMKESQGFFWYGNHEKILSFVGAFVYELGLVGIILVVFYLIAVQDGSYRRFLESIFLFLLLGMAISVASPFVPLLLCSLLIAGRCIGLPTSKK